MSFKALEFNFKAKVNLYQLSLEYPKVLNYVERSLKFISMEFFSYLTTKLFYMSF